MNIPWTKAQLVDTMNRPLTQSLFLEIGYTDWAIFTLNDDDKQYNGKTYYSLKKWYLECEDPTEYQFAKKCLLGWRHWKRLLENKQMRAEIEEWREELEIAMRSEGVRAIFEMTTDTNGNFQAAKWLADRGWEKRAPGRPSKEAMDHERKIKDRIDEELNADIIRMDNYKHG